MACNQYSADQREAAQAQAHSLAMSAISRGEHDSRLNLGVLKDVIRRLSAAPGSRNVILATPGFFLTPEMHIEEAELIDRAIRANVTLNSLDVRGLYALIPGGDASETVGAQRHCDQPDAADEAERDVRGFRCDGRNSRMQPADSTFTMTTACTQDSGNWWPSLSTSTYWDSPRRT